MQKKSKNINRNIFIALPLLSVPLLLAFNSREFWLAGLFFLLAISSTACLQIISLKYFKNYILTIIGSSLSKIIILTAIILGSANRSNFSSTKLVIALMSAFLVAKLYEVQIINYINTKQISYNPESKRC